MRILIVGGSGFVGSYLHRFLSQSNEVVITRFNSEGDGIRYNASSDNLQDIISSKYDIVINNVNPQNLNEGGVRNNINGVIQYCLYHNSWLIQVSSFFASDDNQSLNSYTQHKRIAEDVIQALMVEKQYTILRFAQLFDNDGLSRKTQGGLYFIGESIKQKKDLTLFSNYLDCQRNYLPIELLLQIFNQVISKKVKGVHNAYFDVFTLSFLQLIRIFDKMNGDEYISEYTIGDKQGMSYSIEAQSLEISRIVTPDPVEFYLSNFFNSLITNE